MGGAGEQVLDTPAAASGRSSGSGGTTVSGGVRIHENAGEVHLHDDKAKLKVAVPVSEFYAAWARRVFDGKKRTFRFVDPSNKAVATLTTSVKKGKMETDIGLAPLRMDKNSEKIQQFVSRTS